MSLSLPFAFENDEYVKVAWHIAANLSNMMIWIFQNGKQKIYFYVCCKCNLVDSLSGKKTDQIGLMVPDY